MFSALDLCQRMTCWQGRSLPRISLVAQAKLCKLLRGRGRVSRRLNPASFALTMRSFSQARRLGGLHRASPVPFRSSYFTPWLHPHGATPQRLVACWYRLRRFSLIPSLRFVAHSFCSLLVRGRQTLAGPTPHDLPRNSAILLREHTAGASKKRQDLTVYSHAAVSIWCPL
jgi:hypothetical protein